jgi:ParB family chromosome partitioning protein
MRKVLGRGLEALIPTGAPADEVAVERGTATATTPFEVEVDRIVPNPQQPRRTFDDEKLRELAASMREHGVLQPLLVTPRGDAFELVAGERRLRAARIAGLQRVPVLVRDVDARESLKLALLENVQREDLNPVEEALGYRRLVDEFGMTQAEIADRLGKSRSAVANTMRLLQLPADIQARIESGEITAGHARALLGAASLADRDELAMLVSEHGWSVRRTEEWAQERRTPAPAKNHQAATAAPNPALQELVQRLEKHFGTRARIHTRKADASAGRIEIEYYTPGDLERIFAAAGIPYLL